MAHSPFLFVPLGYLAAISIDIATLVNANTAQIFSIESVRSVTGVEVVSYVFSLEIGDFARAILGIIVRGAIVKFLNSRVGFIAYALGFFPSKRHVVILRVFTTPSNYFIAFLFLWFVYLILPHSRFYIAYV